MRRTTITFLILGWGTGLAFGQTILTFKDAVKIGLENNLTLNQQKNQLAFTRVNKMSSLLQLGPTVQADGSVGRFDGNSFNQQRGEVINGQIDFVNGRIFASLPIFNGLNQFNAYRQADNQHEAQMNFVSRSSQDVIRNVASQYLNCLLDQQLLRIDQQNLETQKAQYELIRQQVALGSRAEADLYNQEFQVRNAELLIVRSSNRLKNDKAILAQTLMIDPTVAFELQEVNWDLGDFSVDESSLEQLSTEALQHRSDMRQAELSEKAAQFGFNSVRGRYYPSLSAFGQMSSRYNYIYGYPDNRAFDLQFRSDNRQINYGLSLTIPIFNGFLTRSQVAQSKVTFENAKLNKKNTEVRVKSDVLIAYQNYKDALASYQSAQAQLRSGALAYETEKARFDLGASNIVQLTQANQQFVRAQSDFASAHITLMFQKLLMSYAMGTLKEEDIP
jgi:outer membrane protein